MFNIANFPKSHKQVGIAAQLALLSIVCHIDLLCSLENNGRGARPIALANAYAALADDPWGAYYNPAGLSRVLSVRAATFISPAQFGMSELRTACFGAVVPTAIGGIAIAVDHFGFELYNETNAALAFGGRVSETISLGATTHLHRCSIDRYGTSLRGSFDLGGMASIAEDLRVGWCWMNVSQTTVGSLPEQYPQIMSMGVCYEIAEHARLVVELEKDIRYPVIKKFGFEQDCFDVASIRLGISDNPDKFSCGFGIRTSGLEFSYAGYSHPQLGWTHQVELSAIISP